jgi:putative transposase
MAQKKHKPKGIVVTLRQVDFLLSIGVTAFTYSRWRKELGGLNSNQVKRLKDLEKGARSAPEASVEFDAGGS